MSWNSHRASPSFRLNEGQRAKREPRNNPQRGKERQRERERGLVFVGPVAVSMNRLFILINVSSRAAAAAAGGGGGGGGGDLDRSHPVPDTWKDRCR